MTQILFGEKWELWSFILCNFLHSAVASSHFGYHIPSLITRNHPIISHSTLHSRCVVKISEKPRDNSSQSCKRMKVERDVEKGFAQSRSPVVGRPTEWVHPGEFVTWPADRTAGNFSGIPALHTRLLYRRHHSFVSVHLFVSPPWNPLFSGCWVIWQISVFISFPFYLSSRISFFLWIW